MDFLQGRSETSGTEGRSQTKKLGYAKRPTGFFTSGERDAQQQIANWINSTTGRTAANIPNVETRVSPATYSIPGFFDTPVTEAPKVPAPVAEAAPEPTTLQELLDSDPEMKAEMEKSGFKFRSLIPPAVLATAATVADTAFKVTSAVAGPVLPVIGFQQTKKELEELGISPAEATTQAAAEEANLPMGLVGGITRPAVSAFVEAAKEPFQEETGMALTDKNLERGILSKITGGQFKSSGGFIEKRE